ALLRLDVSVVGRHRDLAQVEAIEVRLAAQKIDGDTQKLAVVGAVPQRAGEGQDLHHRLRAESYIDEGAPRIPRSPDFESRRIRETHGRKEGGDLERDPGRAERGERGARPAGARPRGSTPGDADRARVPR